MIGLETMITERLLKVPIAQRITQILTTACTTCNDASKCRPLQSSFGWRFSFSAMASKITRSLRNFGHGEIIRNPYASESETIAAAIRFYLQNHPEPLPAKPIKGGGILALGGVFG